MVATPLPTGNDIQVNTYTTSFQRWSSVAALADGGFIVTWTSDGQDSAISFFNGIYGQRYAPNGAPIGNEFLVNTYTTGDQQFSSVTGLADGGFVVTWESLAQDGSDYGIYGQRYAADGSFAGTEFRINTNTTIGQNWPSVAALTDGGFVVTWRSAHDLSNANIYGQRYAANGASVGGEFLVNTFVNGNQSHSDVAALSDGGYVVTWESAGQDGSQSGIFAQRYAANGALVGDEFQVNTFTTGNQDSPSVTGLVDGGFVITWSSSNQEGVNTANGIYGQRYAANGATIGDEFHVNTHLTDNQRFSSATALLDGGFLVTWTSNNQDGNAGGVYGQRFTADGSAVGDEFRINQITAGSQVTDTVTGADTVATLVDGRVVQVWAGVGIAEEVFFRFVDVPPNTPGSIITGTAGDDVVNGTTTVAGQPFSTSGDDTIDGLGGNDNLAGLAGIDTLIGREGNDTLDGGTGADYLLGGVGDDLYKVDDTFDLVDEGGAFPTFAGSALDFDTISSTAEWFWDVYSVGERLQIEEGAVGSGAAGTTIVGSIFANEMIGNSGTNIMFGRGGADTYRAGDGIDWISLSLLGLTDGNAYPGVDGANVVIVDRSTTGAFSYDVVFEFEVGKDKIDVSDYGYATAAEVLLRGHDDGAGNSYYALGNGLDYVYLVGVAIGSVSAADFIV